MNGQLVPINNWLDFINLIPPCLTIDENTGAPAPVSSLQECIVLSGAYWTVRLSVLAGIVSFVYLVIGGFQMATAVGDDQKYGQGKKTAISALTGLAVALLADLIVNFVVKFLKP